MKQLSRKLQFQELMVLVPAKMVSHQDEFYSKLESILLTEEMIDTHSIELFTVKCNCD